MTKIWIVGSLGHIGQALVKLLDTTEYQLFETDVDDVDITNEKQVTKFMSINRPDVVINCAGYNAYSEKGEYNTDRAYKVNAVGVRNLAQAAESIQAKMIHLSTDDVFGAHTDVPYNEFDEPSPVSVYGKSKLAGERFVMQLMRRYVIIRSSWIYGIGNDFLDEVLTAAEDENVSVLELRDNSRAVPTSAGELAKIVKLFIDSDTYGVYHAVCTGGGCTRSEYAAEILKLAGLENSLEIKVAENADAGCSVLDNMMLRITGLEEPAEWKQTLKDYINETGGIE